jgi:putative hydrolase of the HAD superfamily
METVSSRTVLLDCGDTLVDFTTHHWPAECQAMHRYLSRFGDCDFDRLRRLRQRQVERPSKKGWRENDLRHLCAEVFQASLGRGAEVEQVEGLMQARCDAFNEQFRLLDEMPELLSKLGKRARLGIVSNYPCGTCVRLGLEKTGISKLFEVVIVSGDIGWCKPHPRPFQAALEQLGVTARDCVFVGDNPVADIGGAKQLGMTTVLTTQFRKRQPARGWGARPDHRISRLAELEALL